MTAPTCPECSRLRALLREALPYLSDLDTRAANDLWVRIDEALDGRVEPQGPRLDFPQLLRDGAAILQTPEA